MVSEVLLSHVVGIAILLGRRELRVGRADFELKRTDFILCSFSFYDKGD